VNRPDAARGHGPRLLKHLDLALRDLLAVRRRRAAGGRQGGIEPERVAQEVLVPGADQVAPLDPADLVLEQAGLEFAAGASG